MTPDEEVAKIFSSDKDDGPSTSKRAKLMSSDEASSSHDYDTLHVNFEYRAKESRSIGHHRQIWDDSSDSDASSPPIDVNTKGLL